MNDTESVVGFGFIDAWLLDLASLMLTSAADVIFSNASGKDLECISAVICNIVRNPDSKVQVHEMAELKAGKVIQQPKQACAVVKDTCIWNEALQLLE